jgi:MFS family permease
MRRLFLLVAAVVLVDTMFFAAVAPLLPHYADEFELSKTGAGVLAGAYPAGTFAGALPSGWLAARWGVKPTLLLGLTLLGVSSLFFAFAESIVLLDAARFVQGVGGACMWAAGMAWLVSATPAERRGELIGSALAAAIVGVLLGPVLGGAATVLSPEAVFSAVAVVAATLAAWAWTIPGVPPEPGPGLGGLGRALRRPAVLAGFWLFTLPAIFAGVIEVLAPLRLDDLGASGAAIGAIFLATAAVEAALSPVAGRASDRQGRLVPIRAGLAGAVVMAVLLPLPEPFCCWRSPCCWQSAPLGSSGRRRWPCSRTHPRRSVSSRASRSPSQTWPGRSATSSAPEAAAHSPRPPPTRSRMRCWAWPARRRSPVSSRSGGGA